MIGFHLQNGPTITPAITAGAIVGKIDKDTLFELTFRI
jgi:hypothetical protein